MSSLQLVDFVDAENQPIDGLVSVSRPALTKNPHEQKISSHERAVLLQKTALLDAQRGALLGQPDLDGLEVLEQTLELLA